MINGPGYNIILIGMPGAGKSTIGPLLSKQLGMEYADTDDIIRSAQGTELKDIVLKHGYEHFLDIQEHIIVSLSFSNHVLATGGSVVTSAPSMRHLKENGRAVYLDVDYDTIEQRLGPGRRLARSSGKSLREVYDERTPMYSEYADIIIHCSGRSKESIVEEIRTKF